MILPINVYNWVKEVITLNQTMELVGLNASWWVLDHEVAYY